MQVKRVTVNAFLKVGCILLEPRGAAQAEGLEARRATGSPRAGADAGSPAAPPRGLPGAPRTPRRARPRPRAQEPGAALASRGALAQRPRRRVSDSEEQPRWRTRPPGTGQTPPHPPFSDALPTRWAAKCVASRASPAPGVGRGRVFPRKVPSSPRPSPGDDREPPRGPPASPGPKLRAPVLPGSQASPHSRPHPAPGPPALNPPRSRALLGSLTR